MARKNRKDGFAAPVTAIPATRNKESHLIQTRVIPFDEEYYDVVHNQDMIWERY